MSRDVTVTLPLPDEQSTSPRHCNIGKLFTKDNKVQFFETLKSQSGLSYYCIVLLLSVCVWGHWSPIFPGTWEPSFFGKGGPILDQGHAW